MDTCLITGDFDRDTADRGLKKIRQHLQGFSFKEDQSDEYKLTLDTSVQNWNAFMEYGLTNDLRDLLKSPYQWVRLDGELEFGDHLHGITLFLYPVSDTKAAVSIAFAASVYDSIYSNRETYEKQIDATVKQDVISLLLLIAASISVNTFVMKIMSEVEDLVLHVKQSDVTTWLTAPTKESISEWRILIAGVSADSVERTRVEKQWPANRLFQSSSGLLIYDGFIPYP